jgi:hypothetical protein
VSEETVERAAEADLREAAALLEEAHEQLAHELAQLER